MTERQAAFGGRGIVYFGNDWFAENRTSSHHIASRLARLAPLLYVSSPGLRKPQASGRDVRRLLRKLAASLKPPRRIAEGMWHCTVPQLPFRRLPGVDAINRLFGVWAVRRALRIAGIGRHRLVRGTASGFLAGRLGDYQIYYCIDDCAHPGVDAAQISHRDAEALPHADPSSSPADLVESGAR